MYTETFVTIHILKKAFIMVLKAIKLIYYNKKVNLSHFLKISLTLSYKRI